MKDYQNMETNYRALQNENYQLREYILNLQSRLLESDSSFPPAPSHINLQQGSAIRAAADDATAQLQREMEREREKYAPPTSTAAGAMAQGAMSQLQSAASQATEVDNSNRRYPPPPKRPRTDEGIAPAEETRAVS